MNKEFKNKSLVDLYILQSIAQSHHKYINTFIFGISFPKRLIVQKAKATKLLNFNA